MHLQELRMDWKVVAVIIISTLLLVIDHYHSFFPRKSLDGLLLYLGAPLLIVLLIFRESPAEYGFRFGDWKMGLLLTLVGCGVMAIVMTFVARTSDFRAYYAPQSGPPLVVMVENALDLFGWEFFFRGFLLFALYRVCGPYAILLQAVPFTIAHNGKPELETLSCIFGGALFGYVAWRTRSFFYPFLIHWFLATFTILLAG